MSHLVKKACQMRDVDTLLKAVKALGWEVQQGGRVKFFNGLGEEECTYVVKMIGEVNDRGELIEEKYTLGIQIGEKGELSLLHDDAMNGAAIMSEGKFDPCTQRVIGKLQQSYQVQAVRKVALRKGQRLSEKVLEDGRIVLRLETR